MKFLIVAILVVFSIPAYAGDGLSEVVRDKIVNYHEMNEKISTSGKLAKGAVKELGHNGFKTIIDLRTKAEGTESEKQAAESVGINYINIPVTGAGINDEQLEAFTKAMENVQTPVLIHCASGNRVGAMWTTYQLNRGTSPDEAFAQGRKIGMKPSLEEKVKASCQNC